MYMEKVKIYILVDPINEEVKYVGKTEVTLEERLKYHIRDNKVIKNLHKKRWINNLLKKNLKPLIFEIDLVNFDEWKFWEKYWIEQFRTWGFNLTNIASGGEGYSSEYLKKLWKTPSYRNHHTKRVQGKKNPFYGKKHSEETKAILREKCPHPKGKLHPCYGKKHSEENKIKCRENQPTIKKIYRFDLDGNFIDEWKGIKYMCRILVEHKFNDSAVIRVAQGKQKYHKGHIFKYSK